MTAPMRRRKTRETPSPLSTFIAEFAASSPGSADLLRVAAQLGIPPDLRYLVDGLLRSDQVIRGCREELADLLLRNRSAAPLAPDSLLEGIEAMRAFAMHYEFSSDDSPLARHPMERATDEAHSPMRGYGLGTLHHWSLLFYATPPEVDQDKENAGIVESICEEYAPYALAAHSLVPAARYEQFVEDWWRLNTLPSMPLLPDSAVASRLREATRAIRCMGIAENLPLLQALTDKSQPGFCERLVAAQQMAGFSEDHREALNQIALLVECLNPTWRTPGKRRRGITGVRRSFNRGVVDGYTRVSEGAVRLESTTEEGIVVASVYTENLPSENEADNDEPEFGPLADRLTGPSARIATVSEEISGRGVASHPQQGRWMAEHARRHNFAHALPRARVLFDDVDSILSKMQSTQPDPELRELLVRLNASIALGVAIQETGSIILADGPLTYAPVGRTIVFRRDLGVWCIRVFPPAFVDAPILAIERPVSDWLSLPDVTGFGALMERFGFGSAEMPNKKLGRGLLRKLADWMEQGTGDRHATITGCAHHLFHRVLSVTRGDLVPALILTGESHSHARSAIHYGHYRDEELVRVYVEALHHPSLPQYFGPLRLLQDADPRAGFGARHVPTEEAVYKLVSSLRGHIRKAFSENDHIAWHNAYTAYTLVGYSLGLALRAITDPHLRDLTVAIATFSDKAPTDYHRRVVAFADILVEQSRCYAEFRRIVAAQHGDPEDLRSIAFAFRDPVTGQFEPFRPIHFQQVVGEDFPLELYSLRRYCRTSLLECPDVLAEDVDAMMGHWHDGVSPHDRRSTYPPQRLIALARGPVTRLLEKVGYQPMRAVA